MEDPNHPKNPPTTPSPIDIIFEILILLPAITLLRLKSVCKQWHSLISSHNFVHRHLNKSLQTNSNLHLILPTRSSLSSIDLDNGGPPTELNLPRNSILKDALHVIGSCNGLLCISDGRTKSTIIIYNPITRSFRLILCPSHGYSGFGYDSVSDDYKIIGVDKSYYSIGMYRATQIFSLRSNSWKKGPIYRYYSLCHKADSAKFTNNSLHWLEKLRDCFSIVAFELHDETFNLMPLPDIEYARNRNRTVRLSLGILSGGLCLQLDKHSEFEFLLEVWVMKEYGLKESWTRLFRLPCVRSGIYDGGMYATPLALSRDGNKVLLKQDYSYWIPNYEMDSEYFWYELGGKNAEAEGCFMVFIQ